MSYYDPKAEDCLTHHYYLPSLPKWRELSLTLYRAFTEEKFPVRLMQSVHRHYFQPQHDEFKPRTVWSLSNAFTSAFKEARPDRQYELTARLGKFLGPVSQPN